MPLASSSRARRQQYVEGFPAVCERQCAVLTIGHKGRHQKEASVLFTLQDTVHLITKGEVILSSPLEAVLASCQPRGQGTPRRPPLPPPSRPRVCVLRLWVPPSTRPSIWLSQALLRPSRRPPRLALAPLSHSLSRFLCQAFSFFSISTGTTSPLSPSLNSLHSRLSCSKSPKTQIALKHSDTTLAFA